MVNNELQPVIAQAAPNDPRSTHELVLVYGNDRLGLRLKRGLKDIFPNNVVPQTQQGGGGGGQFGAFGPTLTELEQTTWEAGRGWERWAPQRAGFFDSKMMNTWRAGQYNPAPQAHIAQGYRDENRYWPEPRNVSFVKLYGTQRFASQSFVADALDGVDYNGAKTYLQLRKHGAPADALTVSLTVDSAGNPGADIANTSITLATANVTDILSLIHAFIYAAVADLNDGTTYHVKIDGGAGSTETNCWELGVDAAVTGSKISSNGSAWSAATFKMFYRVVDTDIQRRFRRFEFQDAWYVYDQRLDEVASKLWIEGDRGRVTTAQAVGTNLLIDINSGTYAAGSWPTNRFAGGRVKIFSGPGKGQLFKILSNTGDTLTIDGTWRVALTTASYYVIFGVPYLNDISPAAGSLIDGPIKDHVVANDQVFFAMGTTIDILRLRYNTGVNPPVHAFADDLGASSEKDLITLYNDPTSGPQLVGLNNTTVATMRASIPAIGVNISWSTEKKVGDTHQIVNSLTPHENQLQAIKSDGIWYQTTGADRWNPLPTQLQYASHPNNGLAAISFQKYFYFSYGEFTFEELIGQSMEDVGPWQNSGLPEDRKGPIKSFAPLAVYLVYSVDAGEDGYSTVMIYQSRSHHNLYEHYELGQSIRQVDFQSLDGMAPRIWISAGADYLYQIMADKTFNPEQDTSFYYHHESVLVSATYDSDANRLFKAFRRWYLAYRTMDADRELIAQYQTDTDIGSNNWITIGGSDATYNDEEGDDLPIKIGGKRRLRTRTILRTKVATKPVVIIASVLSAFTRLPNAMVWGLRVAAGEEMTREHNRDHTAHELWTAIKKFSGIADVVRVESFYPFLHGMEVTVSPPTPIMEAVDSANPQAGEQDPVKWAGYINLNLIEAD